MTTMTSRIETIRAADLEPGDVIVLAGEVRFRASKVTGGSSGVLWVTLDPDGFMLPMRPTDPVAIDTLLGLPPGGRPVATVTEYPPVTATRAATYRDHAFAIIGARNLTPHGALVLVAASHEWDRHVEHSGHPGWVRPETLEQSVPLSTPRIAGWLVALSNLGLIVRHPTRAAYLPAINLNTPQEPRP